MKNNNNQDHFLTQEQIKEALRVNKYLNEELKEYLTNIVFPKLEANYYNPLNSKDKENDTNNLINDFYLFYLENIKLPFNYEKFQHYKELCLNMFTTNIKSDFKEIFDKGTLGNRSIGMLLDYIKSKETDATSQNSDNQKYKEAALNLANCNGIELGLINNDNDNDKIDKKSAHKQLKIEYNDTIHMSKFIPITMKELIPITELIPFQYDWNFDEKNINENIEGVDTKLKQYCFESNLPNNKAKLDKKTDEYQQPSTEVESVTANANIDKNQQIPGTKVKGATCSSEGVNTKLKQYCFESNLPNNKAKLDKKTDEYQKPSTKVKGATCSSLDKYFSQLFSYVSLNI